MFENADTNSSPSQNDEYNTSFEEYLKRAAHACNAGDAVLGMHLYLAAFEKALPASGGFSPSEDAIAGLKQAWALACRLKERSLAEYIFEKMEPYLSSDEVAACAEQLQRLAIDKLEEFGLTREDLEDMTDMISQDFLGLDGARVMKVEHVSGPLPLMRPFSAKIVSSSSDKSGESKTPAANDTQAAGATLAADGVGDTSTPAGDQGLAKTQGATTPAAPVSASALDVLDDADAHATISTYERLTYHDVVGYNEAISLMRDFGVGMQEDPQFQELVSLLNTRHGLDSMPAADALLFRSPAREDANRFMAATLGELGLPAIRMRMEENLQGMPVLCVMAQADNQPKLNAARNSFEGPGVVILEDLDIWTSPFGDMGDELGGFMFAGLSRGAREALSLIRSGVENPEVFVLASASDSGDIDSFFLDMLEPLSIVEIDYPTAAERADIWMEIARDHPSMRCIDQLALVRYSTGMPRYDIYMAAREAIEDAYKSGLVARCYMPVTPENLYEKLAAYQPLDSKEYHELEDAVINDFRSELENLDDLLKGDGE